MILKAFKYRIYPTVNQSVLIDKHIGSCRFVYNLALETKQTAYAGNKINLSCFELIKQLPELKKECKWLKEVNSQSLQSAITNLDCSYTNFFKGISDFPKYKSKNKGKQSFCVRQNIELVDNKITIPKFKEGIKIVLHRKFEGKIKQATILKTPTNKYYVSILVETTDNIVYPNPISEKNTIGVDLGIKHFLTTSSGLKIENPRYLKNTLSKLKYSHKKYSKSKSKKNKYKLQKIHEKIANQRNDFLHKTSINLIKSQDTIALETLKVKNMIKNHSLAQSIIDASWHEFVRQVEYKAKWYGTNILRIGLFEPSSKTCSNCGKINKELKLSQRDWECDKCKTIHDRDINASVNIKNFALRNSCTEHTHKNCNELPTLVGVMTYKAT